MFPLKLSGRNTASVITGSVTCKLLWRSTSHSRRLFDSDTATDLFGTSHESVIKETEREKEDEKKEKKDGEKKKKKKKKVGCTCISAGYGISDWRSVLVVLFLRPRI